MEKIHAALLVLLRAGLWERKVEDTSCFPLTEEEWKKVYLLSRQQTVTGVVFQGILLLAEEFLPSESLLVRWMAETDAIERKNRRMNQVLASLVQMFISIGVSPVLQKGQGVASFYEKPLWRECGDIDFYFESQQEFERASYFVRRCKLQEENMPDQSVAYTWKGVQIEHHTRLLDLHNPFLRYYAGQLVSQYGYSHMAIGKEKELEITVPSPVLNLLLQSLHILKHALGWGIGLRQLCDLARTCYILYQEVDAAEMKKSVSAWDWDAGTACCMPAWWIISDCRWSVCLIRTGLPKLLLCWILSGGEAILGSSMRKICAWPFRCGNGSGRRPVLSEEI